MSTTERRRERELKSLKAKEWQKWQRKQEARNERVGLYLWWSWDYGNAEERDVPIGLVWGTK